MTGTYIVVAAGLLCIGLSGFLGRRRPTADLSEWTVGGRRFGTWAMWFLQAGEVFTTFTFLGLAGLVVVGGVAVSYVLAYLTIAYVGLFFLAPRYWQVSKRHGFVTNSDFLRHRFRSPALGHITAVVGVVFLLPYLQLQVSGLGMIVELVTGDAASSNTSMIVAVALVMGFVLWAGIRGVASASYLKDVLMVVVLGVLIVGIPLAFGGHGRVFPDIQRLRPDLLTIHGGSYDHSWYLTSILVSGLGMTFMTLPYMWAGVLSARNPSALRRNYTLLPLYSAALWMPVFLGFLAVLTLPPGSSSNSALLTITRGSLPGWLLGLVIVGGAATAMVPSAGMVISMAALVSSNLVPASTTPRRRFRITQVSVVVILALSLLLALTSSDLLANLLLLTYSGLVQLAPGNLLGLAKRRPRSGAPILAGIVAGEAVVVWLTFWGPAVGHINVGLLGLVVNLLVLAGTWARTAGRVATAPPRAVHHAGAGGDPPAR